MADIPCSSLESPSICLSCGKDAIARDRHILNSQPDVSEVLTEFLMARLKNKSSLGCDLSRLDHLVKESYLCRKCFESYKGYIKKRDSLYQLTENSVDFVLQTMNITSSPSTPRSTPSSSTTSISAGASTSQLRKRLYSERDNTVSPPVTVSIPYRSGTKRYRVVQNKKVVKSFVRSTNPSKRLALDMLKDDKSLYWIVNGIGKILAIELRRLSSKQNNSAQRKNDKESVICFPWGGIIKEAVTHCPILTNLLLSCTTTKSKRQDQKYIITTIICILSKYRCPSMSLFQKMISMILYSGHAGTKVYDMLNHLKLCMGKTSSYNLVTLFGNDYDAKVLSWITNLIPNPLSVSQPMDIYSVTSAINEVDEWEGEEDDDETEEDRVEVEDGEREESDEMMSLETSIISDQRRSLFNDSVDSVRPPSFSDITSDNDDELNVLTELNLEDGPEELENIGELNSTADQPCYSYKLVGDNIDKNIKRRNVRVDKQTISFHGFHCCAVRDRIDFSGFEDHYRPSFYVPASQLPVDLLLPSQCDKATMEFNFSILISRVLVEELKFFSQTFDDVVTKQIKHCYSNEMSKESEVVPLGVLDKNENDSDDLIDIMLELHKYVPVKKCTLVDENSQRDVSGDVCHAILIGDQLTRKRMEGVIDMRRNSKTPITSLRGLVPTCEDWHAKGIFLEVVWKYFYSTESFTNKGTLCQLRNIINRRNVSAAADKDFNACDDFFKLVTRAHIVAAAMKYFEMTSVDDLPKHCLLSESLMFESEETRKDILEMVCKEIVLMFVRVKPSFGMHDDTNFAVMNNDKVLVYASSVLSLGLLYEEFSDAIHEADGQRILRCWRFFMPIFKKAQRKNYAIEALNLLSQYYFFLTPRQAEQLIWSRCVNTCGKPGKNIPCDLLLEHLNRSLKMSVGPYKTPESICRASKCLGATIELEKNFRASVDLNKRSSKHSVASSKKDFNIIVKQLLESDVFSHTDNREHSSFKNLTIDTTLELDISKFNEWMKMHLMQMKETMYYI